MAKIKKVIEEGSIQYPATITDAVKNPNNGKTVTQELSELGSYVSNPEYIRAYTDAEGRFLWGIKQDGSIEWAKGVPTPVKKYIESLDLENDEEVERINQLVIGLLADVKVLTDTYHYVSSPEWACAIVDAEERILMGIKADGRYYIPNRDMYHVESNPEYAKAVVDSEGKVLEGIGIDGKKYFPKQELLEKYNDPEGRSEITLDADGKILSYRDSEGVKHENKQHTKEASFDMMNLTSANATQIEQALKANGFTSKSPIDWSDKDLVELPIPRQCALVNFIVDRMATTKADDLEGFIEYWDKDGNYFKKPIILNAQGSSSMEYVEKNQSVDFTDCEIKFGNWVVQDSFHFKCYYIDVFRGIANVCYNYVEEIIKYCKCRSNRIVLPKTESYYNGVGKFTDDFGDNALCHPDGFPIEVYLNGEYYGLFAWNLKKHRKNYSMNKSDATKTLLDGTITSNTFFGGSIDWTQFELRNPKDLVTMDGREYDADTNCNEIIDETSSYYDPTNKAHVNSKTIKSLVVRQSQAIGLISAESNVDVARTIFEEYYDKDMIIIYYILSNVLDNYDGFGKNWLWTIYGNVSAPNFYDMDSVLGRIWKGNGIRQDAHITTILGNSENTPTGQAYRLYKSEIERTYKELKDKNLISTDKFMSYLYSWMERATIDAIERNIDKWQPTSYREPYTNSEYWEQIGEYGKNITYDEDKSYNVGETCFYGIDNSNYDCLMFKCIKPCRGQVPATQLYPNFPKIGGMFDSPNRIKNWLEARIAYLDSYFNYNV